MNIAIHGERELLVRMRDSLMDAGLQDDEQWNLDRLKSCICMVYFTDGVFTLFDTDVYSSDVGVDCDLHHLTPSNYNEILNIIIERKNEKE